MIGSTIEGVEQMFTDAVAKRSPESIYALAVQFARGGDPDGCEAWFRVYRWMMRTPTWHNPYDKVRTYCWPYVGSGSAWLYTDAALSGAGNFVDSNIASKLSGNRQFECLCYSSEREAILDLWRAFKL
ncbi:hypothetical protein AYO40_03495 [Planctomycetaceae bacterium SCGC AG-212-D15]|nr:hypothetical protein AYO40_03495 [Planctomycetaceae bacterium SCGC AG-212-D15]